MRKQRRIVAAKVCQGWVKSCCEYKHLHINRHKILVTDPKYPFRELSTYLLSVAQRFPLTHCGVNDLLFASEALLLKKHVGINN